eukprot:UN19869
MNKVIDSCFICLFNLRFVFGCCLFNYVVKFNFFVSNQNLFFSN